MNPFTKPLTDLFEKRGHRIVFWYDEKSEFRNDFESLILPGVTSLEPRNNEFAIKYRVLRQEKNQKFLIYLDGPAPELEANWLLDLQLASGSFKADQMSLWMAELGLGASLEEFCRAHQAFLTDSALRAQLGAMLKPDDDEAALQSKMIACVFNSGSRLEEMLAAMLAELAANSSASTERLARLGLADPWWEMLAIEMGYTSQAISPADLALQLFKSVHQIQVNQPQRLKEYAKHILDNFKNNVNTQAAFDTLSELLWKKLDIEAEVSGMELDALLEADLFAITDKVIVARLAKQLSEGQLSFDFLEKVLRSRKPKHWYKTHQDLYECIASAEEMLRLVENLNFTGINSIEEGIEKYSNSLYRVDQLYRKSLYHYIKSNYPQALRGMMDRVEKTYTNTYLLKLGNQWKLVLDQATSWNGGRFTETSRFYEQYILPLASENRRVAVIISDALRYETGKELAKFLESTLAVTADVIPALAMLPSYTQLGMAALLPHRSLSIAEDGSNLTLADGQPTTGLANRQLVLQTANRKSVCLEDEFVLTSASKHIESEVKGSQVIYIYHNQIDAAGDKIATEETVFEAVEAALRRIRDLVDKLQKVGVNNILITADHGFVYQQHEIADSDYSSADLGSAEIITRQRRYVVAKNLGERFGLHTFTAKQLGLEGDLQFGFPTGYGRLRLSGSGSRYVHGGTSLQEVVVPVIRLGKQTRTFVTNVNVTVIGSGVNTISTGQITLNFLQQESVSEERLDRELNIGFYAADGTLISDNRQVLFNFSSENPREREIAVRFLLSNRSREYNNQTISLIMKEPVYLTGTRTDSWQQYGPASSFLLKQSITTDF